MDARKQRYGEKDLARLFRGARRVLVGKGARHEELEPGPRADYARALGPSGNLRAPVARVGDVWLVGFCEEAWESVLG